MSTEVDKSVAKSVKLSLKRPQKSDVDAEVEVLQKQITELEDVLKEVRSKIDKQISDRDGSKSELEAAKTKMSNLSAQKRQLMEERAAIITLRDAARDSFDTRKNSEKSLKSDLKFNSVEEIDAHIRELETKHRCVSLQDEKKLIKDIKALQQSKLTLAALGDMKKTADKEKDNREDLEKQYKAKMVEINAVSDRITAHRTELDRLIKGSADRSGALTNLRQDQLDLREKINAKYELIKGIRANFKQRENEYFDQMREERERQKELRDMEIAQRKEREEELAKEREAQELARIPYEEEIQLCDFLLSYLQKFCKDDEDASGIKANGETAATAPTLGGMKPLQKDDDDYFGGNAKKSKGKKKGGTLQGKKEVPIKHGVESISLFASIGIAPPTAVTAIPAAVASLKEKKAYYKKLERGAIPSLGESRKQQSHEQPSSSAGDISSSNRSQAPGDFPDLSLTLPGQAKLACGDAISTLSDDVIGDISAPAVVVE